MIEKINMGQPITSDELKGVDKGKIETAFGIKLLKNAK